MTTSEVSQLIYIYSAPLENEISLTLLQIIFQIYKIINRFVNRDTDNDERRIPMFYLCFR